MELASWAVNTNQRVLRVSGNIIDYGMSISLDLFSYEGDGSLFFEVRVIEAIDLFLEERRANPINEASPGQALSPRARLLLRRSGVSSKCCFIESAASGGELDP
jgi:hypothetical protein